jgi:predicted transcriptional regulator
MCTFINQKITMLTKKEVLKTIKNLPDQFEAEEAIEKIVLLQRIQTGLRQSEEGKLISEEQVKKRLSKWLR